MRRGRYVVALRRVFSERESGEHRLPVRQRTDSLRRTCHVRQLADDTPQAELVRNRDRRSN